MYRARRPFEIESPGCSMIGAVIGLDPSVRIAPVAAGMRMLPVAVRSGAACAGIVGTESVRGASGTTAFRSVGGRWDRFDPATHTTALVVSREGCGVSRSDAPRQELMRASPCSRSAIRSRTSSMPTDRRTTFSGTARAVPRTEAWVMSGG
jgi:hypothetical protein